MSVISLSSIPTPEPHSEYKSGVNPPYLMAERNSLWKRGAPNRRAQTTQSSNRSLGRTSTDPSLK